MTHDRNLPRRGSNAVLEDESISRLRIAIPRERILIRDERHQDYGIDLVFEVMNAELISNKRASVQVKARSQVDANLDGSLSISVATSTLNYLLNGVCPIVILYNQVNDEFRYEYLHDIIAVIGNGNPDWLDQDELTLRLTNVLNEESIDEICSRISSESDLHRSICGKIAERNSAQGFELSVNPATLEVTTAQNAKDVLRESGIALVSHGFAEKVLSLLRIIPEEEIPTDILFIAGYASFSSGKYLLAKHHLSRALADSGSLEERQEILVRSYSIACDYYLGIITREEYLNCSQEITEKMFPNMMHQNHLIQLRERMLAELDFDIRDGIREEIRDYAKKVMDDPSVESRIQDSAELSLVEIQIETAVNKMASVISSAMNPVMEEIRTNTGVASKFSQYEESVGSLENILSDLESLLERAANRYEPLFYIEIWYTKLLCMISVARQVLLVNEIVGERYLTLKSKLSLEEVNALESMTKEVGNTELQLRVKMLEAHFWDIQGDTQTSNEIATAVKKLSTTLSLSFPLKSSNAFLSGETSIHHALKEIREQKQMPIEQRILDLEESELGKTAIELCREMGIPEKRSGVILEGLKTTRKIAHVQRTWCKHIGYVEKNGSEQTLETTCLKVLEKRLFCGKKELMQSLESTNVEDLLPVFMKHLCKDCDFKEPYK